MQAPDCCFIGDATGESGVIQLQLGEATAGVGASVILQGGEAAQLTGGDVDIISGYSAATTSGSITIERQNPHKLFAVQAPQSLIAS
ncbi:hypothetical protein N9O24_00875 [bacterium]|nr:hypothetical protein [bacterium]